MRYKVDATRISHDRLEDEVIVINVGSGAYYSGSGPAADIWTLVTSGASIAETARMLASAYSTRENVIVSEVEACVKWLLERGLIDEDSAITPSNDIAIPDGAGGTWRPPIFDEYTDMWQLIKLDPIHEVDEVGWPMPKP